MGAAPCLLVIRNFEGEHKEDVPGGSVVTNSPANAGDVGLIFRSESPLEMGMAIHSSILACSIPRTE